jgi:hypothetical protein
MTKQNNHIMNMNSQNLYLESVLASPHRDKNPNYIWTFVSLRYWGENPNVLMIVFTIPHSSSSFFDSLRRWLFLIVQGNWTLTISSETNRFVPSTLYEFALTFYGIENRSTRSEPRSHLTTASEHNSSLILRHTSGLSLPNLLLVTTVAVIFIVVVINVFLWIRRRKVKNREFVTELEFNSA